MFHKVWVVCNEGVFCDRISLDWILVSSCRSCFLFSHCCVINTQRLVLLLPSSVLCWRVKWRCHHRYWRRHLTEVDWHGLYRETQYLWLISKTSRRFDTWSDGPRCCTLQMYRMRNVWTFKYVSFDCNILCPCVKASRLVIFVDGILYQDLELSLFSLYKIN